MYEVISELKRQHTYMISDIMLRPAKLQFQLPLMKLELKDNLEKVLSSIAIVNCSSIAHSKQASGESNKKIQNLGFTILLLSDHIANVFSMILLTKTDLKCSTTCFKYYYCQVLVQRGLQ